MFPIDILLDARNNINERGYAREIQNQPYNFAQHSVHHIECVQICILAASAAAEYFHQTNHRRHT